VFIAVDDTDSRDGLCTTFVLTEIVRSLNDNGIDIIGDPRLIRLNPAVPWKTRGNASLVLQAGIGSGERRKIGEINGKDVLCFSEMKADVNEDELMEKLIPTVVGNRASDSDTGLIVSKKRPSPELYWKGVRKILEQKDIEKELRSVGAKTFTQGCGRGLIGAACGLSWIPKDSTFELIAYRERKNWGTERTVDPETIRLVDVTFESTFNSWEERFRKVTMVPSTPCPVLYGLRGDDHDDLLKAVDLIVSEKKDRWLIFLTNQGTDDHIITDAAELNPDSSYRIEGIVKGSARHLKGGHTFLDLETEYGTMTCGLYEPSKEFRMVFDHLIDGDMITVVGELRNEPRTLNVEKILVNELKQLNRKVSNPQCPKCGKKMKSIGKDQGYRCKECRTRSKESIKEEGTRWIVPGWYEPPAAARRHLSKPLKRDNTEQRVEFVNRRIQ
jgi:Predicted DNA-binding protein containing a Zn-ribbon domain